MMEYVRLNNGTSMPSAGVGVFLQTSPEAEASVASALKMGVRLVDTANAYCNERGTGRGIAASGVPRDEIYLVTKLWPTVYEDPNAVDATLARLGVDYVDLLFIHQPTANWREGYRALERAVREGKARSIGLSNFEGDLLREALDFAEIQPQAVQVEAHPYFPQTELKAFLAERRMALMAWYPLGHGDKALLAEPVFAALGQKYGKSPAQIVLRWHAQVGNVVIPGSRNPDHIRDNFDIFDFELTQDELAQIAGVDKNKRYYYATPEQVASYAEWKPDFDA